MAHFLVRFSYASLSVEGMIRKPDLDLATQASMMAESLGAKLLGYWFAFGEFDGVVLMEAADGSVAASIAMAIRSTAQVSRLETTVLLTMDEARVALRSAAKANHLPPGAKAKEL